MKKVPPVFVPHAPVSAQDVVDAARVVLGVWQRDSYVSWRENRWYSDTDLGRRVQEERREVLYARNDWTLRVHVGDVFSMSTALDVLVFSGSAMASAISSLDQLGLHHERSTVEDFEFAVGLLDRPELFDPIREMGIALSKVRVVEKVFGVQRLRLAWLAGWSDHEVMAATYAGVVPEVAALEALAALRATTT